MKFYEASGLLPISEYKNLDLSNTIYSEVVDDISNGSYTTPALERLAQPGRYDALSTGVQGLLTGQSSIDQVLQNMDAAWGN